MDNTPLARSIDKYLDIRILDRIAEEYEKGRLLLVSTTNLDTGKPVIWNIGAIAASGHPSRLELVRKIMLASASIPGLFPPVMIDVLLDQTKLQEMHVDGGASSRSSSTRRPSSSAAFFAATRRRRGRPPISSATVAFRPSRKRSSARRSPLLGVRLRR